MYNYTNYFADGYCGIYIFSAKIPFPGPSSVGKSNQRPTYPLSILFQ